MAAPPNHPIVNQASGPVTSYLQLIPGDLLGLITLFIFDHRDWDWPWDADVSRDILSNPGYARLFEYCTATGMHRLIMSRSIQDGNLLNYIFPVERLAEPAFRARLRRLEEQWGYVPRPNGMRYSIPATIADDWDEHPHVYLLFLAYFSQHRELQPRVPFCCRYLFDFKDDTNIAVVDYPYVDRGVYRLTIHAQPYHRILHITEEDEVEYIYTRDGRPIFPADLRVFENYARYIYLPAGEELEFSAMDHDDVHSMYDCDIGDFEWFHIEYINRYGAEPERLSESDDRDD